MKMKEIHTKALIAAITVLTLASWSMAGWFHEDFESYVDESAWMAEWPLTTSSHNLTWTETGGIDGPKNVGGTKTYRRQMHDLTQHMPAGMTSVIGTNSQALLVEVHYFLREPGIMESQSFRWDLSMGTSVPPRSAGQGPRDSLGFGAFPTFDGTSSRANLMYYDGENWNEITTLKHGQGWNTIRAVIQDTTVSFIYSDENMSNGVQTAVVPRAYLGGFDTIGIASDNCPARVQHTDGYDLDGGVFVPEPAMGVLLGLSGLMLVMRRRRVA